MTSQRNASGQVTVSTVDAQPTVVNPNGMSQSLSWSFDVLCFPRIGGKGIADSSGGTNFLGKIVFAGEGQGDSVEPALFLVEPTPPYNSTSESAI